MAAPAAWLAASLSDLEGLGIDAEAEGGQAPASGTIAFAREALGICARSGHGQPLVDHDAAAGVEIYLKEEDRALLIAVRADGDLCVFRDGPGPSGTGRDRRQAGSEGWTSWLRGQVRQVERANP